MTATSSPSPRSAAPAPAARPPKLRLWPGLVILALMIVIRFVLPLLAPDNPQVTGASVLAGLAGGVLLLLWWLFASRATRAERWIALAAMAGGLGLASVLVDPSIATGMMGLMLPIYAVPTLSLAFGTWTLARDRMPEAVRIPTMVAAILVGCLGWALVRTGGFDGDLDHDFAWRWAPTAEERLLADDGLSSSSDPVSDALFGEEEAAWPGFRGAERDGRVRARGGARPVAIATDWSTPPTELWRRPVGPGWSSFAVRGGVFYTQEQRGEEEVVSCYRLDTGEPLWLHANPVRFWESNAGAGPRGTPTLVDDRVYAFGATGLLDALDGHDGSSLWSRDVAADLGLEVPHWGFSSSPLVVDDVVLVAASGQLAAYDRHTGEARFTGEAHGEGYSSPQLLEVEGERHVVFAHGDGVTGLDPTSGAVVWEYEWSGYPIVQPAVLDGGDLLVAASESSGVRRLALVRQAEGWGVEERWRSIRLKPYFNDFVLHEGHAYGFDGRILAAVDLAEGERQWKGGRYGNGQMLLLAERDLLLVLSEDGEVALVAAEPDSYRELARMQALEGKTWNHPVLVGDVLLVRNSEEMAAFRLPRAR